MPGQLRISVGQLSEKGRKEANQDFHGVCIPREPHLSSKGIAIALADGISSSGVSRAASEVAVRSLLEDYFFTSEAWSVKKSVQHVLSAANSWLHSQTRQSQYRFDLDRGYVCTLSAMVIKSTTAHLFHVGDTRIYRLQGGALEQLTADHRVRVSAEQSHLGRAIGITPQLEIDYRAVRVEVGDVFVFTTDGVYEFVSPGFMAGVLKEHAGQHADLDLAARAILDQAHGQGSPDNVTIQIVRVDELPHEDAKETYQKLVELPFPPLLTEGSRFDGYRIVRELHASSRSHIYLALDGDEPAAARVAIKIPSIDLRGDAAYLERFLMEDWIARRINSPHVLKPHVGTRQRNYLYTVMEFIEGQTLTQWMRDHPKPALEAVRGIVEQIAKGLRAFHRLEMLHQDLRADNVMLDATGTVKIIDFGSARVAGVLEIESPIERVNLLGTAAFTAPEYFLGDSGTERSDLFSLGVLVYQMLSGSLPYGTEVSKARTRAEQRQLAYRPLLAHDRGVPAWVDGAIARAVHPDPARRYEDLSEFTYDLRYPNAAYQRRAGAPLLERNPVLFWKGISLLLAIAVAALLVAWLRR
jgi:serine/threonine protein phosphatase PrpC/predicted Ser/Thr protein kinase